VIGRGRESYSAHRNSGLDADRDKKAETMSIDRRKELKDRTKAFALRVIKMSEVLPRTRAANVITNQILRSATSMAANYRAAGRARSMAEFVAKMGVVVEEADETVLWLELLTDSGIVPRKKMGNMLDEASQLC
jgi:four helix bundle protein